MDRVSKAERELVRKIQKQTHADRIRAMSDEDLAMLLQPGCPSRVCIDYPPHDCYSCWLDWLKQEATNDQNNS